MLNNREIAVIIWTIIAFIYALSIRDVRKQIPDLIISFLRLLEHPIGIIISGYICLMFIFLYYNKLISNDLIKDYLVWIVIGLIPVISKVVGNYLNIDIKSLFFNFVSFSIIPMFIVNEYTFSLWAEVILVPFASLVTMDQSGC